jgi:hypothetical protein
MEKTKSLRDRILEANSEKQVDELLAEGAAYQFASPTTRRKWEKAARRRKRELNEQQS